MALLGSLFAAATLTPVVWWWGTLLAGPWNDPKGEVLIVLAGSVLDTGMIGGSSYWRSVYAAETYREGGFRQVIISGGPEHGPPAALPMKEFLKCQGVPAEAIQVETRSVSTRDNALFTRELLAEVEGRKVLLTSDYHMYRASRVFRKAGLEVLPRPFPDVRKRAGSLKARWPAFLDLAEETLKIAWYYARGWI